MKLTKIYPSFLKRELKHIYIIETGDSDLPELHRHLPDGTYDLLINLGPPILDFCDGKLTERPDVILIGGYNKFFHLKYPPRTHLLGVIFDPAYAPLFLNDRLDLISNSYIPADFVFGPEINEIASRLIDTATNELKALLVEVFLQKKLQSKTPYYLPNINRALEIICQHQGRIRISQMAKDVCMSERNFRRIFTEHTGYSPHEMIKIRRVKKMAHLLKKGNAINLAARFLGYYDSAHLIHDFQSIAGINPTDYIKKMTNIDHVFFKKSEYADIRETSPSY